MRNPSSALSSVVVLSVCFGALEACGSSSSAPASASKPDAGKDASAGGAGSDAGSRCGDGQVAAGETCDTAIAAGKAGACPVAATCDDGDPCTLEDVKDGGTCAAACEQKGKAAADATAKDSCCPAGATAATDADCNANCGNGKVDTGETCDTAIKSGTGVCKTTCTDDGNPCTKEALVTADPCNPTCSTTTITTAKGGDGCCPSGATLATDSDCTAVCGNGIVESGEDCEGTSATCKACKFVPTALRMETLTLLDPHTYFNDGSACTDITDVLNTLIAQSITTDTAGGSDGGGNGTLDLSFALVFRPLQESSPTGRADFVQPICVAPDPPAGCSGDPAVPAQTFTYANKSTGTCLAADSTNLTAAYTAPNPATAGANGCFVSDEATLRLPLSGIALVFDHARVAGQWVGDPATGLVQGLFTGFMSVATADSITLPSSLPVVGGKPLSAVFPIANDPVCTGIDDRDYAPDGTTRGWWWHLNFTATTVPWTE